MWCGKSSMLLVYSIAGPWHTLVARIHKADAAEDVAEGPQHAKQMLTFVGLSASVSSIRPWPIRCRRPPAEAIMACDESPQESAVSHVCLCTA